MRPTVLLILAALAFASAAAQPTPPAAPIVLPTPGGRVVSPDARMHQAGYQGWHFAPARVDGDLVFISGIVAGAREGSPLDAAGLEAAFRRAWQSVKATLEAAGAGTDTIVDLTTFHLFQSPHFKGTKAEHLALFAKVKDEFVPEPYPAWTAIGVSELVPPTGLVEIKVVARLRVAPGAAK
ncbi:RidA family protein [Oleiharenicola sp. Vm1]|uniref:RidA family protein n=1 Tax=Oleiharenicola sp. Vm1 TaxID=3398393 RepID=UPI0039F52E14